MTTEAISKPIAITVSLDEITPERITLKVTDLNHDVLASGLTFDDVFANADWSVWSVEHPIRVARIDGFDGMAKAFDDLVALNKLEGELRSELSSTCNTARYNELKSFDGPLSDTERRVKVASFIAMVALKAVTGVWPHKFRELGL